MIGNPMNDEQTNFKVTDRRLFNPDGTPREVPPEERPEPKPPAAAATSGVSSGRAEAQSTSDERAQPEAASDQTLRPASATTSAASSVAPMAEATSDQAAQTSPAEPAASRAAEAPVNEEELLEDPAGFVNFMMSIASNAAASLGMMEHPVTHQREVDLELAKHWIDILGMLQKKTRGNLLPQEEKILEGLLADLRMQFVSHTSSAKPKASRAYTGRDIVGG